jgi:uncharacterized protein YecE (DUF72 family)
MATVRVGISGWRYEPWRGTFYPEGLPQRAELEYASAHLSTIEINGSFYSLQRPESYASWYADTPADFVFAVKGPRFITHMKRLRDVEIPLANFFASGVFNLKEKLGPILWQFPPNFRYDRERFEAFLQLLPADTEAAAALAHKHDARLNNRTQLEIDEVRPLRHAVEIRHESFLEPSFVDLLRKSNVALVVAETARRWPMTYDITADFVYMRLHGDKELYRSGYSQKALDRWAGRIRAWHKGSEPADAEKISTRKPPSKRSRDVYCFFDNTDVKLRAPFDAQTLMRKLRLPRRNIPVESFAPRVARSVTARTPRAAKAPTARAPRVVTSLAARNARAGAVSPRRSGASASRRPEAAGSRR